jgi:hypothetical protein
MYKHNCILKHPPKSPLPYFWTILLLQLNNQWCKTINLIPSISPESTVTHYELLDSSYQGSRKLGMCEPGCLLPPAGSMFLMWPCQSCCLCTLLRAGFHHLLEWGVTVSYHIKSQMESFWYPPCCGLWRLMSTLLGKGLEIQNFRLCLGSTKTHSLRMGPKKPCSYRLSRFYTLKFGNQRELNMLLGCDSFCFLY